MPKVHKSQPKTDICEKPNAWFSLAKYCQRYVQA